MKMIYFMRFTIMRDMFRPKIGLALGGGGPKGLAHIGVIKTLLNHGIPIDCIAGTSAGALIGSLYAYSQDIESVERHIMDRNRLQLLSYFSDVSLNAGFIGGNRIEKFLGEYIKEDDFKSLKVPFTALAVNLIDGKLVHLNHGSVVKAVRASIAIPVLFKPVEIDDKILVDGGLISQVPVNTAFAMGADIVIAVQLDYRYDPEYDMSKLNPLQVGGLSFDIVGKRVADDEIKKAHIVIRPHLEAIDWGSLVNEKARITTIRMGVEETERNMLAITQLTKEGSLFGRFKKMLNGFLNSR